MKELKNWQIFSFREHHQELKARSQEPKQHSNEIEEPDSKNEYIAYLAAKWADHRFTTMDGRRFAYVEGSHSILNRSQVLGLILNRRERALLERGSLVGAIVEFGTIDPPMVYGDSETLKSDWLELHQSFRIPLTEEESIAFNVSLPLDPNAEDEDFEDEAGDYNDSDR